MRLSDLTKIPLNIKMVTDEMIENLFYSHNNEQYRKYMELTRKPRSRVHSSRNASQKKTTNIYADGGREIIFDNGVRKEYFPSGYSIIFFANGDIKQVLINEFRNCQMKQCYTSIVKRKWTKSPCLTKLMYVYLYTDLQVRK